MKKETILLAVLILFFSLPMILLGYYIGKANVLGIIIFAVIYTLIFSLFMCLVISVNKKQQ